MSHSRLSCLALLTCLVALCAAPAARAQISGVIALPSPAQVKAPVTIVAQGAPFLCDAFVDFGDGVTRTVTGARVPFTVTHTYQRPGTYLVQIDCGVTVDTTLVVAPPASLPFSLSRIELRWDDGRGYVSVPKGAEGLRATADLLFNGSGQLVAQWLVDGRVLAPVTDYLTFGARKTLRTPDVPPLPTFEPGIHRLTLRIVQPPTTFEVPVIQYFVAAAGETPLELELLAPEPSAKVAATPLVFRWKPLPRAASYRVDLLEADAPRPVASALARGPSYSLSGAVQRRLTPLESYRWRVSAIDAAGAAVAQSEARSFTWDGDAPDRVVANQLLAALRAAPPAELEAAIAELETRYSLRRREVATLESLGLVVIAFEPAAGGRVADAVRALRADERIVLAEPHFLFATQAAEKDPLGDLQYAPKLIGALIAHSRARGRGVRVAVIDSGVDADHPDLTGRIAVIQDFTGGGAGAEVHGSAVAGVIAALEGNGVGIAGAAPASELLALRACRALDASRAEARCEGLALARAFDFALRNGARVVNLSVGGPRDALVTRLVDRAESLGVLVVAAGGNQGPNGPPLYPAALDLVVAAGAVDAAGEPYSAGTRADFIDLVAPGVEVLTTAPAGRYHAETGSSLAAAHVSAVAALVLELRPSLSPRELRGLLSDSARPLADAPAGCGRGRVDACRALERVLGESLGCPP